MERGRCKTCRREMLWVMMESGTRMPLDPEPTADGNVHRGSKGRWRALTQAELQSGSMQGPFYLPHFKTCPQAAQHRRHAEKRRPVAKVVEVIEVADGTVRQLTLGGIGEPRGRTRRAVRR